MPRTLRWPLRVVSGRLETIESEGVDAQAQHVSVLMVTRPRDRVVVPDYGTPDPVGSRDLDEQAVLASAERWCPRAVILDIDSALNAQDSRQFDVTVQVGLR